MSFGLFVVTFIVLFYKSKSQTGRFHGYNDSYFEQNFHIKPKSECASFASATKPFSTSFTEKLSLWKGVSSDFDNKYGEVLYGSEEALLAIHNSQNPENCSTAKYIISAGWNFGFGSRIHVEGTVLALAMEMGRVYLSHPDGDNWTFETSVPFCENDKRWEPGFQCFYRPFSKCTIHDALQGTGGDVNHLPQFHRQTFGDAWQSQENMAAKIQEKAGIKSFVIELMAATKVGHWSDYDAIPSSLKPLIKCSPMREDAYFYWWRIVAATYFVRPNTAMMIELKRHADKMPIPDYKHSVAMFVRHGDKGVDMKLLDFKVYAETATLMWQQGMLPGSGNHNASQSHLHAHGPRHHLFRRRLEEKESLSAVPTHSTHNGTLFITTEDPLVLEEAEAWGQTNHWNIAYTELFDRSHVGAQLSYEKKKSGAKLAHDDLEYISMLLNLEYALKSEAWVCTQASNSCRIIDELRCTIGAKCNRFYADLSANSCSRPPCIDHNEYMTYFGE